MAPHACVAFNFFTIFIFFLLFYARDVNIFTRIADFITAPSYEHTHIHVHTFLNPHACGCSPTHLHKHISRR